MRVIPISDTHCRQKHLSVPDGDILIHAGDFCSVGRINEFFSFMNWFSSLPHKYKIFIAGNHDLCFESDYSLCIGQVPSSVYYLQDSFVEIEGLKIWGSPWQPEFYDWAFNLPRGDKLREKWDLIPDDTDILITHGPPHGILDMVPDGSHVGCEDLLRRVEIVRPQLHIFGHIHYANGITQRNGTIFINASNCSEEYKIVYPPPTIDI